MVELCFCDLNVVCLFHRHIIISYYMSMVYSKEITICVTGMPQVVAKSWFLLYFAKVGIPS